jgi:hypothetical protein
MSRRATAWAAIALAVAAAACSEVTFEGGGPVSITLNADKTTAKVGQNVLFSFDAVGSILDGVTLDYGDAVADTMYTLGSVTAHGQFLHAYTAAGTYRAIGTAWDARQGPASDTVVIQITGG